MVIVQLKNTFFSFLQQSVTPESLDLIVGTHTLK